MKRRVDLTIEKIIELSKQGLTIDDIVKQSNVCFKTIYNRINAAKGTPQYEEYMNLKTRPRDLKIERIIELTKQGLTLEKIAEQQNVSVSTVCKKIIEAKGTPEYEEYKKLKIRVYNITIEKIIELTKQGLTIKEIAKQENVSIVNIYRKISNAKGTPEYEEFQSARKK